MDRLVITHAEAHPHTAETGRYGPPLSGPGLSAARLLREELRGERFRAEGISITNVAASELLRTQQTAYAIGAINLRIYSLLNEVTAGLPRQEIERRIAAGDLAELVAAAQEQAERALTTPPIEPVIVTHRLLAFGISNVLGHKKPMPNSLEVRRMNF